MKTLFNFLTLSILSLSLISCESTRRTPVNIEPQPASLTECDVDDDCSGMFQMCSVGGLCLDKTFVCEIDEYMKENSQCLPTCLSLQDEEEEINQDISTNKQTAPTPQPTYIAKLCIDTELAINPEEVNCPEDYYLFKGSDDTIICAPTSFVSITLGD